MLVVAEDFIRSARIAVGSRGDAPDNREQFLDRRFAAPPFLALDALADRGLDSSGNTFSVSALNRRANRSVSGSLMLSAIADQIQLR